MVKTTIMLEDSLYRELVDESIREYGGRRKLSALINRKLRNAEDKNRKKMRIKPIRLGRKLGEKELEKAIEGGWTEAVRG